MTNIQELEHAVLNLPDAEYGKFRRWFLEEDAKRWDEEFAADVKAGKLDFLAAEAHQAKQHGRLRNL